MPENLRKLFENQMALWPKEQRDKLKGDLLEWGSVVVPVCGGMLWTAIESQVNFIANKYDLLPSQVIEKLFESQDADTFMFELQI